MASVVFAVGQIGSVAVGAVPLGPASPGPEIQNLSLTATSPGNLTTDDLMCSYDLAGTATTAATAWFVDGSPLMSLYVPMEGGATNTLNDYSGHGLTVTSLGSPSWNDSAGFDSLGAYQFDGIDDAIVIPDTSVLDVDYVTLSAWVYVAAYHDDQRIISKETGTTQPYSIYSLLLGSGVNTDIVEFRLGLEGQDRVIVPSNSTLPLDQWTHVAATFNGTHARIYINGVLDKTQLISGILRHNDNPVYIGGSQFYSRFFEGRIDEARIYAHALSDEQISSLYNDGPDVIKYTETDVGEQWQAYVTPFSSVEAGSLYVSNTIGIEVDSVPPVIVSVPATDAYAGWLYTYDVDATGYPPPTYQLIMNPGGMTIDSTSGLIQWVPAVAGSAQVVVQASNVEGTDLQNFTIAVQESLAVFRIMPLGNSITYDNHSGDVRPPEERISYRYPLWQLMTNAGYDFRFVGSLSAGSAFFPEPKNEGHPGWRDDQIADSVYTYLQRNPADIVLLHIGTNGLDASPNDVEDILDEIDRYELDYGTQIWVILARIINRSSYSALTTTFNDNVEAMALARTTDKIIVVDMEDGAGIDYQLQPLGDMWDNLHPNDLGYAKMADVWFSALQTLLPTPAPLVCPSDMTHYWKMDEAYGTPLKDSYGSNDAVATNVPTLASGVVAGAQDFDGVDDQVDVPDDDTWDWGANDSFSVEFWINKDTPCAGTSTSDNEVAVGRDDAGSSLHWWIGVVCTQEPPGVACFQLRDVSNNGDAVYGSTVITDGDWHHVVAVRDAAANMNRIYVDGIKEDSLFFDYPAGFGGAVDLNIGYLDLSPLYHLDGTVDEIATYDKALTDSEVLSHYLGGLAAEGYCADVNVDTAPTITSTPLTEATVLQPYTYDVNATGFPFPTYELLTYPAGMSIDSLTGVIEWTPAAAGSAQVMVEAHNSHGTDTQSFTIDVREPPVCPPGMISYWKLDEASGSTYDDYYDGHDGQASVSAPTPSSDAVVGWSQDFNGTNDRITIADHADFDWAYNSSFTVELWAKFTNVSSRNKVMIGRDQGGGSPHWWLGAVQNTGEAGFYLLGSDHNGVGIFGGTAINDDQWHHLVAVRDEGLDRNRLYVDGVKVDSTTYNYTAGFEAGTTVGIGYMAYNGNPDYFYDGRLDEVAVYDRALSDAEVLAHYSNGLLAEGYCSADSSAPTIVSTPVTDARVGELYTYDVNASGIPAPTYSLTLSPAGMSIDSLSGVIDWTPAVAGSAQVTVEANNSEGTDTQSFTIFVVEPPACPPELTHYWGLDEPAGPTYEDLIAGDDATCASCPVAATGIVGGAQQFDGISNEVNAPDDDSLDWGMDASFSIAYWVKTSASTAGNRVIAARDDAGTNLHWWVGFDDSGTERFQLRDVNGNGAYIGNKGAILNDGFWHFMVAVRDNDADMNRIYVDGVKTDSAFFDYTAGFGSDVPLNIGFINLGGRYRFNGVIDELATFDKALTDAEILDHYNDGLAGNGYCTSDSVAPAITSTPVTSATTGQLYTYDVDATGLPLPTYGLTVFPVGMAIDTTTGVIDWTPAAAGSAQVTVEARNSEGTDSQSFVIQVTDPPVFPAGMVSYWQLNETSGATYGDYYDAHDGTASVSPPTPSVDGVVGGSQDFNGTTDRITVADDPEYDWTSTSSFTVEVWAKFTNVSGNNKVMIGRDQSGGRPHWWLGASQNTGEATFILHDSNSSGVGIFGSSAINDGQWHHLVAVRDESVDRNRLYVDGVKVDSATYDYTAGFEATTTLGMGYMAYNGNPGFFYDGLLDEAAIYGRALSDAEVLTHYADGMAGLGYWAHNVITVNVNGGGVVTRSPDQSAYFDGAEVVVTAVPDSGWVFDGWSDGLTGNENPDTLVMGSDTTVTATFAETHALVVSTVGNGVVTKSPDQAFYLDGDTVVVAAVPDSGWVFGSWSGGLTGSENPDTLVMGSDTTVTATFLETHLFTTNVVGNGIVTKLPDQAFYLDGDTVVVTAVPDTGWVFDAWSDGLTGNENPDTLVMGSDTTVTATFLETHLFTTNVVGNGIVTKLPDQAFYLDGDTVVVTAVPDSGWAFDAWSDGLSGSENPDTVVMNSDTTVTATFVVTHLLTTNTVGNGIVTKSPDQAYYVDGDTVVVTAVPDTGWVFDAWSDGLTGSENPDTLVMGSDTTVTATFTAIPYTLTTNVVGQGSISVEPDEATYIFGDTVVVTAVPDTGWVFDAWSDGLTGNENPDTLVMGSDTSVTATFLETHLLTTNTVGGGVITKAPDQAFYVDGDTVIVTAVPDSGWVFDAWSDGLTGSENPDTLVMGSDTTVTATFIEEHYTLTANTIGDGTITRAPDQPTYLYGDTVVVTAVPDVGWVFDAWSDGLTGSENPDTLVMGSDTTVTATFIVEQYSLTVNTVGMGIVTKAPDRVTYTFGDTVIVTAVPDTGWVFDAWSEGLSGSENPDTLVMGSDTTVTAAFTAIPYTLTTNALGQGSISVEPDQTTYIYGDTVIVTAVPDTGWVFGAWSQGLTGSENPDTVVMGSDTTVTAIFVKGQYVLAVNTVGNGTVTRAPDQMTYFYGDTVVVTAVPDVGWVFDAWSEGLSGSENPDTLVVGSDTTVTATFIEEQYTLTLNTMGNGTVTKAPDQSTYLYGDTVIVTAVPDSGWVFDAWSDGLTGSENPDTLIMTSDTTVTATFEQSPTGVDDEIPVRTTVMQNRPNPFNPTTTIDYALATGGPVSLRVYDVTGRLVRTLVDGEKQPGVYAAVWDGRNDHGQPVATGVYFYRLRAGQNVFTKKAVLLK
jgi:hypothetical protein